MKFCFVVGFYPEKVGGAEYQSRLIADNLKKDNEIIYISIGHEKETVIYNSGYKVYMIKKPTIFSRLQLYYSLSLKINNIIDKEKPDKIYHRVYVPYSYFISKYAYSKSIPFYLHIADVYSISFNSSFLGRIRKKFFMGLIRNKVKVIVQTTEQLNIIKRLGVSADIKIPNLHNKGVKPKDNKEKIILWIGKAIPIKRLDLFLDLAERYDSSVKFVVISSSFSGNYGNELLKRINRNNCNVTNLGKVSNDFINKYLEEKALLLINTSDSEGFSNTFLQSWMRGVPVVSLNSNPDNLFDNNKLGFFCANSFDKMQQAVDYFLLNKQVYTEYSNYCFDYSNLAFSIEEQFDKLKAYLEKD